VEYAEVIVNIITDAIDRPFHYRVPENLQEEVYPGRKVQVPFGSRKVSGYVWNLIPTPEVENVREIASVEDQRVTLTPEFLEMVDWFCKRYFCRTIEAINLLLPPGYERIKEIREKVVVLSSHVKEKPSEFWEKLARKAPRQNEIMQLMLQEEVVPWNRLLKTTGVSSAVVRELEKKGLLKIEERAFNDKQEAYNSVENNEEELNMVLTPEQQSILTSIEDSLKNNSQENFLIHGVTGSGKTEVYLRSIKACLRLGKNAIILVPEIALTPQMIAYFKNRLPGEVALLHSQLPLRERYNQWFKVKDGRSRVVLGTRSAIFAPLENIGVIIIDEEQENSYKQEETPRYHAREVAEWRASYYGATLVMGSATPSIESYWKASTGQMKLVEMKNRATPFALPLVEIVDMRAEMRSGNRSIFSKSLWEKLNNIADRGEQALLFINRRGFSNFVLCRECGFILRCPHCSVSLTFHSEKTMMVCHYCFYVTQPPEICPDCKGTYIKYFGAGTQRVEQEIKKYFPQLSVMRMDRDTTSRKGTHKKLWQDFRDGKARIMIGTQMIAKGMDFPGVTLVGVVAADTGIHLPDFRAAERTFQLMTQVSGRAGRGEQKGEVVVQTYHPNHYSIVCVKEHDYHRFYNEEIEYRRELGYPPFEEMLRFLFISQEEGKCYNASLHMNSLIEEYLEKEEVEIEIMGPAPAPLFQIKRYFRYQLILKGKNLSKISEELKQIINNYKKTWNSQDVRLTIDFNPQMML